MQWTSDRPCEPPTEQHLAEARQRIYVWRETYLGKKPLGDPAEQLALQDCFRDIDTVFRTHVDRTGRRFHYLKEHVRRAIVEHWWWPSMRSNGSTVEDQSRLIYKGIYSLRAVPEYQGDLNCARGLDMLRAIVADGEGRNHSDDEWFHTWNVRISCQVLRLLYEIERVACGSPHNVIGASAQIVTAAAQHAISTPAHSFSEPRATFDLSVPRRRMNDCTPAVLNRDEWASLTRVEFPQVAKSWHSAVKRAATDTSHQHMLIRHIQRYILGTRWWDPALSIDDLAPTAEAEFKTLLNWLDIVRECYKHDEAFQELCGSVQKLAERFYDTYMLNVQSFQASLIETSSLVVVLLAAIDYRKSLTLCPDWNGVACDSGSGDRKLFVEMGEKW
jgi:hypothetical protein